MHHLHSLWPEKIVHDSPRDTRPTIIQLPHQRPGRILFPSTSPIPAPGAVRRADALGLHELGVVDVGRHVERVAKVFDQVEL
jgi:hypothetical protein